MLGIVGRSASSFDSPQRGWVNYDAIDVDGVAVDYCDGNTIPKITCGFDVIPRDTCLFGELGQPARVEFDAEAWPLVRPRLSVPEIMSLAQL